MTVSNWHTVSSRPGATTGPRPPWRRRCRARPPIPAGDTLAIPAGLRLTLAGPQVSLINGVMSSGGLVSAPALSISGASAELRYVGGSLDIGELQLKGGA